MRVVASLALLLVTTPAFADVAGLGPCGPVDRRYDGIELPAVQLHRLGGTPLARLGVVAFRDGRATPIPFQVDERRGRKLALPSGPEPTTDDKPGVLDADDLLVFMACDAGDRATPEALRDGGATGAWREIRVDDPIAHTQAFVYVVVADRPPTTERRYVGYETGGDMVTTARYRVGFVSALPNYFALVTGDTVSPNLIDGLRLRAEATLRADLAHWKLNEQQGEHQLIAWKSGAVRAVRRSRHQVVMGLGIHLTAGIAHTYFYPQHIYGPGSLRLPFSPGVLFRDIRAYGAVDGRDLRGWRYYAPGVPAQGFSVDGHTDDAERAFDAHGEWFVLAHDGDALLFVTRLSENLASQIAIRLVYRDDADQPNPPESSPGTVPLAGYEGTGVEKLPGGRYQFSLRIFALSHYRPGAERQVLAQLDAPVTVALSAEGDLSGRAAPEAAPEATR